MATEIDTNYIIRMVFFTSSECVWCPPIERVVKEVLHEGGMDELVHMSIIDVDTDEESKNQYDIMSLPKVFINDKLVLEGGMDDDTARDLLWTAIMQYAFVTTEEKDLLKKSLLTIEMNLVGSMDKNEVLRPSIGDFTHIGTYQQILLSLYSLDPLVPYFIYNAGFNIGKFGIMHHILHTLTPELSVTIIKRDKFKLLGIAFEKYFSNRELYSISIANSATVVKQTISSIYLRIDELASASIKLDVGEPMCSFIAGQLAGVTTVVMGEPSSVYEYNCLANGKDFCAFQISIAGDYVKKKIPANEDKQQRIDRRYNFYEIIHEITGIVENSILMKGSQRPNAKDFIHISVLQPIIITLKLLDSLSGVILYSSGRELGVFGPGKSLLDLLRNEQSYSGIPNIETGMKLLYDYLTHPTSYLSRDYGRIRYQKINDLVYHMEIEDNACVSGMKGGGINLNFCDFQAGFLAGRLHILIGHEPKVKEIECQGTGYDFCKFEFTIKLIDI